MIEINGKGGGAEGGELEKRTVIEVNTLETERKRN